MAVRVSALLQNRELVLRRSRSVSCATAGAARRRGCFACRSSLIRAMTFACWGYWSLLRP